MLLGSTLATLSSGILSVSVVPLMDEFRVGLRAAEWLLLSYSLVFAAARAVQGAGAAALAPNALALIRDLSRRDDAGSRSASGAPPSASAGRSAP